MGRCTTRPPGMGPTTRGFAGIGSRAGRSRSCSTSATPACSTRRPGGTLDTAITELAAMPPYVDVVERLVCLRGVSTLTAFALTVELGDWSRFPPRLARPISLGSPRRTESRASDPRDGAPSSGKSASGSIDRRTRDAVSAGRVCVVMKRARSATAPGERYHSAHARSVSRPRPALTSASPRVARSKAPGIASRSAVTFAGSGLACRVRSSEAIGRAFPRSRGCDPPVVEASRHAHRQKVTLTRFGFVRATASHNTRRNTRRVPRARTGNRMRPYCSYVTAGLVSAC